MKLDIAGRLKYPALSEALSVIDIETYLNFCEVTYKNFENNCFTKAYAEIYGVGTNERYVKSFISQVKENVNYAFVLKQKDLVVLESSDSDYKKGFLIIEDHVLVVDDLRKIFEVDFEKQAFYDKSKIKNLKLNGYTKETYSLCDLCGDKYLVRFYNTGFCSVTCTAKALMTDKDKCKICSFEGPKHSFFHPAVCSLYCREFAEHPSAKWLESQFGLTKASLDESLKEKEGQNLSFYIKCRDLRDIYERKDQPYELTLQEFEILGNSENVVVIPPEFDVFELKKKRLRKKRPFVASIHTRYNVFQNVGLQSQKKGDCFNRCRVLSYEARLDNYGLKEGLDDSEDVRKHEHQCFSCGLVYQHNHHYKKKSHPQFLKQCGNPDCYMWGLNSKLVKAEKGCLKLSEEVELNEISALNIVIRKPIYSIAPLIDYNPKMLGRRYQSKYTVEEHLKMPDRNLHSNLAFERWYLEKEMYTGVISQPHYIMAGAPLRLEKYDLDSHLSVPVIIPDDEKRQQELRKTKHLNYCFHRLEECDCVKKYEVLSGTHTLYYFNEEILENIKNINYMALIAHIYLDALQTPEVEKLEVDNDLNMEMKVLGNKSSYKHKHPAVALSLISKEFNIFIIGELQSTQLLWCVRKSKSLVRNDFLKKYLNDQFVYDNDLEQNEINDLDENAEY